MEHRRPSHFCSIAVGKQINRKMKSLSLSQKRWPFSLTLAERLSPWPGPVGKAYPLCRAVQRVSHCAGEANLAAHFEVPRLSTRVSRRAGIPAGVRRVACNTRQPERRQWEQRGNVWAAVIGQVCECECVPRWAHLSRRAIDRSHNVPNRGTVQSTLGLQQHIF